MRSAPRIDAVSVCGDAGRGCTTSSPLMISAILPSGTATRSSYVARFLAGSDIASILAPIRGRVAGSCRTGGAPLRRFEEAICVDASSEANHLVGGDVF